MVNNKCSVPYCPVAAAGLEKRGKGKGNVTHFSFPKDLELRDQWVEALGRANFIPTTSSRVCEVHFNRGDFIPPKNPTKLHVVKRLRDNSLPTRHLGDGGGLEELIPVGNLAGVELETVVTDGTVHYETIEEDINLRPQDEEEQTIQISDANVETIIVKMETDHATQEIEVTPDGERIIRARPIKKDARDAPTEVPQEVLESTMEVENGYFERFLVKSSESDSKLRPPIPGNNVEPEVVVPMTNEDGEPLTDQEKIEKLVIDLKKAYKKNQSLAKANKSLRLQLHQASKKTLSQKTKHEIVREIMSPFFTQTQIDCFCRPSWMRSRNWTEQDFDLALTLRKLMSKKAFGYIRKKRIVPMPSLTSLRKYQRQHGIVIHHNPNRTGSNLKGSGKAKKPKRVVATLSNSKPFVPHKVMQAINVPVSTMIPSAYEGQQIQIVNSNGATIGTVQGVLAPNSSSQVQTIQLQVVDSHPEPKVTRIKTVDENWKFIQVTPDGQTTTYIQQK